MSHTRHIALRILLALFLLCLLASPAAAKQKVKLEDWLGKYCNATTCLDIYNVREGTGGILYLTLYFFKPGGESWDEQIAPLDEKDQRKAGYSILEFTLGKDGKTVEVTRDTSVEMVPEDGAWIDKVFGTYTKQK